MLADYIGAGIIKPGRDALPVLGKVKKRKLDASVSIIGGNNSNSILDTRIYEFEFLEGRIEDFAVNVLAADLDC